MSYNGNEKAYKWLCVQDGLVLERSYLFPKYRIRNPATKQKLDLPNPREQLLFISMFFLSTSNDYKVVYIHHKEGASYTAGVGAAVLTIGTDPSWRTLDIPNLHNMKSQRGHIFRISIAEVYYIIGLGDYVIVCLEMETENFISVQIPEDLFPDWENIQPLNWRGKLALASVVGEKINIWVLESYKKQKWANIKVVFPLDSIVNDPSSVSAGSLMPFRTEGNWLWINANYERRVAYNMKTNRVSTLISAPPKQKIMYVYRPSLVHFKGMTLVEN